MCILDRHKSNLYSKEIALNTIENVKEFCKNVMNIDGYVTVSDDNYVVDGKSILGIFSLNLIDTLFVTVEKEYKEQLDNLVEKWSTGKNYLGDDRYMLFYNLKNVEGFFNAVNKCKGRVELISDNMRINLKSTIGQIVAQSIKLVDSPEIKELEVVAELPEDINTLFKFMQNG